MLKSTAGGGGIGMRVCYQAEELRDAFDAVVRTGKNNFSDAGVFIEKYIERARHPEVQLFGDGRGEVIALGVRDCSVQRRNQKVLEETPAPNLPDGMEAALCEAAIKLGRGQLPQRGYRGVCLRQRRGPLYFLEVNTRLQVEHGVTEQVWGVDLVRWMIDWRPERCRRWRSCAPACNHKDTPFRRGSTPKIRRQFQPSPWLLTEVVFPENDRRTLRIDSWVESGCDVPPF